ncbi:MAG: glycosyltransferase [Methanoregula sp.]
MINTPFLSICILTFNRSEKLNKLLINIKEQIKTFDNKNKIEILVADNCSTDNTEEIVNICKFYFTDTNLKYYKHLINIGADKNTDFLYRNASGKYVWLMADNVILKENAVSIVYNLLLDYQPSAMLFSYIQGETFTLEKPTFNIPNPVDSFTNYEQAIRIIFQSPKISIYVIKKEFLDKKDDFILNSYLDTNYYHVTLMLYIFFISETHSLLVYREPLVRSYSDCLNLRYSPRTFGKIKWAISLPHIVNNYPKIINDIQIDYDDTILSFLIADKLGNIQLDASVKEEESKWAYSNIRKLLVKKNTRLLLLYFILLNSPVKWIITSSGFCKLFHIAKT